MDDESIELHGTMNDRFFTLHASVRIARLARSKWVIRPLIGAKEGHLLFRDLSTLIASLTDCEYSHLEIPWGHCPSEIEPCCVLVNVQAPTPSNTAIMSRACERIFNKSPFSSEPDSLLHLLQRWAQWETHKSIDRRTKACPLNFIHNLHKNI